MMCNNSGCKRVCCATTQAGAGGVAVGGWSVVSTLHEGGCCAGFSNRRRGWHMFGGCCGSLGTRRCGCLVGGLRCEVLGGSRKQKCGKANNNVVEPFAEVTGAEK